MYHLVLFYEWFKGPWQVEKMLKRFLFTWDFFYKWEITFSWKVEKYYWLRKKAFLGQSRF